MTRRYFLKALAIALGVSLLPLELCAEAKNDYPHRVNELRVGEEFQFAGRTYRKVDAGWYTKQKDSILDGDAEVIDVETGKQSWMGPVNHDWPVRGYYPTWNGKP